MTSSHHAPSRRYRLLAPTLLALGLGSCREQTHARLEVITDVAFAQGRSIAIAAGRPGTTERGSVVATSATPWPETGYVGSLTLVPETSEDAELSIRIAMGLGRDPASCTVDDARDCILARRKLRYRAGEFVRVPVILYGACLGVACDEQTTCGSGGRCVPSDVGQTCGPDGCILPGEEAPVQPKPLPTVLGPSDVGAIALGGDFSCVRWVDGLVKCWGGNEQGQLGLGDVRPRGVLQGEMGTALPTVNLGTGLRAWKVSAGGRHACAIVYAEGSEPGAGALKCWGANDAGQLGLGDLRPRGVAPGEMGDALPEVPLGPGARVESVALGDRHTCALLSGGRVRCWGANDAGQLGLGDRIARGGTATSTPAALPDLALGEGDVRQIAAGAEFTCARIARAAAPSPAVKCWGRGDSGQLAQGNGNWVGEDAGELATLPFIDLGAAVDVDEVALGADFAAARSGQRIVTWGQNARGQLGRGDVRTRGDDAAEVGATGLPLLPEAAGFGPVELAAGAAFACARSSAGAVRCWGANSDGQLGREDTADRGARSGETLPSFLDVPLGPTPARMVRAGANHACAVLEDASIKCWGANGAGQLGLGDRLPRGASAGSLGAALPSVDVGRAAR